MNNGRNSPLFQSSDHCHSVRVLNFNLSDPPFFQSSDVINRDIQISRGDRGYIHVSISKPFVSVIC
jgi:hypothetical protein